MTPSAVLAPTETIIRRATSTDLARLYDGAKEFYASSQFLKRFDIGRFVELWTQWLDIDFGVIFLAESGDQIEGAIGGAIHREQYSDDPGDLVASEFFWFVREECRGSAGLRLYRKFVDWAKRRGAKEIQMVHLLDSMPDKLERFYRREGYELIEKRYSKTL